MGGDHKGDHFIFVFRLFCLISSLALTKTELAANIQLLFRSHSRCTSGSVRYKEPLIVQQPGKLQMKSKVKIAPLCRKMLKDLAAV